MRASSTTPGYRYVSATPSGRRWALADPAAQVLYTPRSGVGPLWQRVLSAVLIAVLVCAPLKLSFDQINGFTLGYNSADASPISDPTAPVRFQPGITQTSNTSNPVPVVNITAPNANGVSLNQYQQFNIDPVGLILNNGLNGGGSLLGGDVAANPNFNGRTASVIINQVSNSAFASRLNGTLEVFGDRANVIIANPNGITCDGCSVVNVPRLTLTTGTPLWLDAHGASSAFDQASAVGFDVRSGRVDVSGLGLQGSLDRLDLIAESVGIASSIEANSQINVVTGRQQVLPTGNDFGTQSNGQSNTAAAITSTGNGFAVDATAFGAMTAGQIKIIGTTQGMGVRADAALAASSGDLTISANGDIKLSQAYAANNVNASSNGNLTASGDVLGYTGVTLSASGDVVTDGVLQSGQNLSVSAGQALATHGAVAVLGNATLQAGGAATHSGQVQVNGTLNETTGGALNYSNGVASNGAMTFTSGGAASLQNVSTASTLTTTAAGDVTLLGQNVVTGVTQLRSTQGNVQLAGSVQTGNNVSLQAAQTVSVPGSLSTVGNVSLTAANIDLAGQLNTNQDLNATASNALTAAGTVAAGGNATLQAGGALSIAGSTAAQQNINATSGSADIHGVLIAGQQLALQATQGNLNIDGEAAAYGNTQVSAAQNLTGAGVVLGNSGLQASTQHGAISVAGLETGGDLNIAAAQAINSQVLLAQGNATVRSGGATTISTATLVGNVLDLQAQSDITLAGKTWVGGNASINSGSNLYTSGTLTFQQDAALRAAAAMTHVDGLQTGGNLGLTAGGALATGGSVYTVGNASLNVGSAALGTLLTQGNLQLTSLGDSTLAGTTVTLGRTDLQATQGSIAVTGNLSGQQAISVNAGTDVSISGAGQAGATLAINAAHNVNLSNTLGVNQTLTVNAGNALNTSGQTLSGGDTTLQAQGNLNLGGSVQANGLLQAGAANTLTVTGAALGNTSATLDANALNISGSAAAVGALDLHGAQSVDLQGSAAAGTTLAVRGGALNIDGAVSSADNLSVTADHALSGHGSLTSQQDVALVAQSTAFGGATQAKGDLRATTTGAMALGNLAIGGNANLNAGTSADLQALSVAGQWQLQTSGNTTVYGAVAIGQGAQWTSADLLLAQGGVFNQNLNISSNGNFSSLGDLAILGGDLLATANAIHLAGTVTVLGNAQLQAAQSLLLNQGLLASGNVQLNAASLQADGALQAQGALTGISSGNMALNQGASTGGVLTLHSGGDMSSQGALTAVAGAALSADGNMTHSGALQSGGALTATAGQALALTGSTYANQAIDLSAGTTLAASNLQGQTTLTTHSGGDQILSGQSAIVGDATLHSQASLNQNGTLASNGALQATAAQNININGSVYANQNATLTTQNGDLSVAGQLAASQTSLNAARDLALNGAVVANGDLNATAGRNASVGGTLVAQHNLGVSTGGDLSLTGAAGANGTLALQAGGELSSNGNLSSGQNFAMTLAGHDQVSIGGTVVSGDSLTISSATAGLALLGNLGANSDLIATAASGLSTAGVLSANHALTLSTTQGTATLGGTLQSGAALQATSGGNIALTGTVLSNTSATLDAAGQLSSSAASTLTAVQNVSLSAGSMALTGQTGAGQDVTLQTRSGTLAVDGTVIANHDLNVTSAAQLSGAGNLNANNDLQLQTANAAYSGTLSAGHALTATATQQLGLGSIVNTTDAQLTAGSGISLSGISKIAGAFSAQTGGDFASAGNVMAKSADVTAQGIRFADGLVTQDSINLNAAGAWTGAGDIIAGTALTAHADSINLAGNTAALAGDGNITSRGDAQFGQSVVFNGVAQLSSTQGKLGIGGDLQYQQTATLTSANDMTIVGTVHGPRDLTATSGGALTVGGVLDVAANTTLNAQRTLSVNSATLGAGAANWTSQQNIIAGAVGADSVNLHAGTGIALNGELDAAHAAVLNAGSGNLQTAAINVTTGALQEQAGGNIVHSGDVIVAGDVSASAGNAFTSQARLGSGGNMTLTSTNALNLLDMVGVVGNANYRSTAGDIVSQTSLNVLGTTTLNAAGNLSLYGATQLLEGVAAGQIATSTTQLTAGGSVNTQGAFETAGGLNIQAGSSNLNGTLQAGQSLNVTTHNGTLTNNAALTAANIALTSSGAMAGSGSSDTAGTLTLSAQGDLSQTGTQSATGQLNASGANVTLGKTLSRQAGVSITGSGNVVFNNTLGAQGNVVVRAGHNLTVQSDAGSTEGQLNLTASNGGISTGATLFGGQSVTLNASGATTLAQGAGSGGALTLTTGSLLNHGQLNAAGTLNVAASGDVDLGDLIAGSSAMVSGRNITTHLLSTAGDLTVYAGNNLTLLNGSVVNDSTTQQLVRGNATLNAAGNVSNSGTLAIGGSLNENAATLTNNSGALIIAGGDATLVNNAVANHGSINSNNLTVTANTLDNSSGVLSSRANSSYNVNALTSNAGGNIGATGALTFNSGNATTAVQNAMNGAASQASAHGAQANVIAPVATVATGFNNQGGVIGALGNVTLGLQGLDLYTSALGMVGNAVDANGNQIGSLTINAASFNRNSDWVAGSNTTTLNVGSFSNSSTDAASIGNVFNVNASGGISNTGTLAAGNLNLSGNGFNNSGTVQATQALNVDARGGSVVNQAGAMLASQGTLNINNSNYLRNAGLIQAVGATTLNTTGTLDNSGSGVINTSCSGCYGVLTLNEGTLNNTNGGKVSGGGGLVVNGGDLDNSFGTLQNTAGSMTINMAGHTLTNSSGTIASAGAMTITAAQITNAASNPTTTTTTTTSTEYDPTLLGGILLATYQTTNPEYISCSTSAIGCAGVLQYVTTKLYLSQVNPNYSNGTVGYVGSTSQVWQGQPGSAHGENVNVYQLNPGSGSYVFALPTVDVTTTSQTNVGGTTGVITSGGDMTLNAYVDNKFGTITSGGNLTVNGDLNNEEGPALNYTVTRQVDQASLQAFVDAYNNQTTAGAQAVHGQAGMYYSVTEPAAVTTTGQSAGAKGLVGASQNMTVNGQLKNSGNIVVGGNLTVVGSSFSNSGYYVPTLTTTAGCVKGAKTCKGEVDARVQSFSYDEDRANITVGGNISITAGTVDNSHANINALGNVAINTTGTLTNTSGTIAAIGGDVIINAGKVINQVEAPVSTHVSYGNTDPIGGCNPGGTYKDSHCSADILNAAGDPALIQAGHNLSISGGSLANIGSTITAGNNANLNITGDVLNQTVMLTEQWRGQWVEQTSWFSKDRTHDTYGTIVQGTQDAVISAGNALTVSGQTVTNSGALSANTIKVNADKLLNGLTDNHTPTPATTVPGQVISLAAGGTPVVQHGVTVNKVAPDVATVITSQIAAATGASSAGTTPAATTGASAGPDISYLKHNAGDDLLSGLSPADLVNNLPANLKPDTGVQFYADPVIEQQLLTQAALQQTGQAYFVNGLSYDDQTKASVADQQKGILYSNAISWAEQNQVQLGTALSADQIAGLTAPMLWYVEEAIPDPACTGLPSCGTVTVLMPQVYLPTADQAALAKQEGGSISGNAVTIAGLNGGKASSVTNTGSITGVTSLNIDTQSLTNQARSVDIGVSTTQVSGGWVQTSGTQVQPGGFITSANLNVTADTVQSIGGAFQVLNASGQIDPAASAQFVQDLGAKLGINYSSTAVSDDIHQDFIKDSSEPGMVVTMVAAIAISVATYGAASGAMAGLLGSEVAGSIATAGLAGMASSAGSQLIATGSLDFGSVLKAGATSMLTAGLTQGLSVGSVTGTGLSSLGTNIVNGAERALISAGVSTAINGGSFGTAFASGMIGNLGATLNGQIGDAFGLQDTGFGTLTGTEYEIAHAALGCAMGALAGGSCAAGAIGGAATAVAGNYIDNQFRNADGTINKPLAIMADTGVAAVLATLAGQDPSTALSQAQSALENNDWLHDASNYVNKNVDVRLNGQSITVSDADGVKHDLIAQVVPDRSTEGAGTDGAGATAPKDTFVGAAAGNSAGWTVDTASHTDSTSAGSTAGGDALGMLDKTQIAIGDVIGGTIDWTRTSVTNVDNWLGDGFAQNLFNYGVGATGVAVDAGAETLKNVYDLGQVGVALATNDPARFQPVSAIGTAASNGASTGDIFTSVVKNTADSVARIPQDFISGDYTTLGNDVMTAALTYDALEGAGKSGLALGGKTSTAVSDMFGNGPTTTSGTVNSSGTTIGTMVDSKPATSDVANGGRVAGNGDGVFASSIKGEYTDTKESIGQLQDYSCAAASCKMAANLDVPEAWVRIAIQTGSDGTSIANIPKGLSDLGFSGSANYSETLTGASIAEATEGGASVIVNVKAGDGVHAIVVDSIKNGMANIRDPWPKGVGSSYAIPIEILDSVMTGKGVYVKN
ncbi:beta strand repeat-containing protein [Amantichitinum ursilacus]|uniref:Filamentous hemagglutinin n=1 Tax=Amantichitinum ursilacus TaxID=857265 RepID=A0A0N1JSE4_9NEIS|nr:filamentous hemagglutinin N-terminal domain-containing protein [Amantichitinum ursilacus]KPC52541.1 Filamentous hemagglutinin [Amantichitinum ursilacus]